MGVFLTMSLPNLCCVTLVLTLYSHNSLSHTSWMTKMTRCAAVAFARRVIWIILLIKSQRGLFYIMLLTPWSWSMAILSILHFSYIHTYILYIKPLIQLCMASEPKAMRGWQVFWQHLCSVVDPLQWMDSLPVEMPAYVECPATSWVDAWVPPVHWQEGGE